MNNNYAVLLSGPNTIEVFDTDVLPGFYDGDNCVVIVAPASFVDAYLHISQSHDYTFKRERQRTKEQKRRAVLAWSTVSKRVRTIH